MAVNFPELEEKLLEDWEKNRVFEQTLAKPAPKGNFVFFEGPPTANGRPGIHHLLARAFKDLIPRFKTMRGYRVDRKAGWDTHGLPVELEVEKRLGLKNKKEIEAYGIAKFNVECRKSVWTYLDDWKKLTRRIAFWLDLEHPYVTYYNEYVESLWWILSEISKKGLLYEGYKVVPYCARCGTALSSHEVAQGYKETEEDSVYIKFKMKGENAWLLAWTTTPWTLPSNTALAVGPDIDYVKAKQGKDFYILAKDRLAVLGEAEVVAEMKGSELIGKEYEPLYSFLPLAKPAHRVVPGDFVSTADGTGIVHMAPFGEEDMEVIKEHDFPVMMTVGLDGAFISEVKPWAGKFVKAADPEIAAELDKRGLLLKTEKYKHDYPFCWRCSTPLLYYPKNSWFIRMSDLRDKLVANNAKINWVPEHIREGRFGEWLSGIKDWALSRERYWGTPLPIWKCEKGHVRVVGSLSGMDAARAGGNRYLVMRHGQADTNHDKYITCWPESEPKAGLTEEGLAKVRESAEKLKSESVDLIFSSDVNRTRQTAEIVAQATGAEVIYDERLRELNVGDFNGKTVAEYEAFFASRGEKISKRAPNGENLKDVRSRMVAFVREIDAKYSGQTILIVSHGDPIWVLETALAGQWGAEALKKTAETYLETGETRELKVPNWPFDEAGALDVHRPFIDAVKMKCAECGEEMRRIPEVLDVWFDSGAMPFAQWHYPFENAEKIDKGGAYPADYIAEAIDQTRGWFYTLLAVSTLLDKEPAYKNVICLGHILDAKGQKMSKSKGNVVDPWEMIKKYGADAIRFHLYTVNQPGDPKRFDEKEVDGAVKKVFLILWNVLSFWKMYAGEKPEAKSEKPEVSDTLDQWILSETAALTDAVTKGLEKYDIVNAGRALGDFVNDLSTWYVRRSRNRFKNGTGAEKTAAVGSLGHALLTLSKLMAPFTPFLADALYKELGGGKESVHLEDWPAAGKVDENLASMMKRVRQAASLGLEKRAMAGIPVRQVLARLALRTEYAFEPWMLETIADEVNVKSAIAEKGAGLEVELDTTLTPELKREGAARELTRNVNNLRKETKLTIKDRVDLVYSTSSDFWKTVMKEFGETVRRDTLADSLNEGVPEGGTSDIESDGETIKVGIKIVSM